MKMRLVSFICVAFFACGMAVPLDLPVPTTEQLWWERAEIAALIHFNMASFVQDGDPACNPNNWDVSGDVATFDPKKLNVSNWIESFQALGAKEAVLTAKHGCGFLLWPTNVTLPDGTAYRYGVGKAGALQRDVVGEFSKACRDAGIGHGFYYSLTNNFYLNVDKHEVQNTTTLPGQAAVSQPQFEDIAAAQLAELWSAYGALTEVWFDGGYSGDMKGELSKMLATKQPHVVAFGGQGIARSPLCWVGTESGHAPKTTWSTGSGGGGDPNSQLWCPNECDTTLQQGDKWFFTPEQPIRTLSELISVYHDSVGRNCFLEIDFAVNRDGIVEPSHARRYAELGNWIRNCYGRPIAQTSGTHTGTLSLDVPPGAVIDRVVVQEDLTVGEIVRNWTVEVQRTRGGVDVDVDSEWTLVANGTAVGNKRIAIFQDGPLSVRSLRLNVSGVSPAHIARFAAYSPCPSA